MIDQQNDPAYALLVKIASTRPSFAKFAGAAELGPAEYADLPATAFAWPSERKFPIHTEKHAAISYAYARETKGVPPAVLATVKKALDIYNVPESIFTETSTKEASDSSDGVTYLLPQEKLFAVKTAADVRQAQNVFLDSVKKLTPVQCATAAGNLIKVAAQTATPVAPQVYKYAGLTVCSKAVLLRELESRVEASRATPGIKVAYENLATGLRQMPAEIADPESLVKVADAVWHLDKEAKLERHYHRKLSDPMQAVFNTTKLAAGTVSVAGAAISLDKLASLPTSFWTDLGGPELANEIAPGGVVARDKLAAIVETLPLDLKVILRNQVR